MKRNILGAIWVMGVLSFAGFCLSSCTPELDVQQAYNFSLQTLPVQKDIIKGAVAEIRCSLKAEGNFKDTRYTIRYFQPDGKGELRLEDGTLLSPNDRYWLPRKEFRLYYTSLSSDRQTIDVYVEDNFVVANSGRWEKATCHLPNAIPPSHRVGNSESYSACP